MEFAAHALLDVDYAPHFFPSALPVTFLPLSILPPPSPLLLCFSSHLCLLSHPLSFTLTAASVPVMLLM